MLKTIGQEEHQLKVFVTNIFFPLNAYVSGDAEETLEGKDKM